MPEKDISNGEIYKLLQTVCNQNKEITQQNNEIKNDISLIREKLSTQENLITKVIKENSDLKVKNDELERKISLLEKQIRENNLLFFNFEEDSDVPLLELVGDFLNKTIGVKLDSRDVVNIYRIGKSQNSSGKRRPILLKLNSHFKKKEILFNATRFKGTGIGVSEDLSEEDRKRRKLVYQNYKDAKKRGYSAKLLGNKVVINGQTYTYAQLSKSEPTEEELHALASKVPRKSVSAPTSPTVEIAGCTSGESPVFAEAGIKDARIGISQELVSSPSLIASGAIPRQTKAVIETRSRSNSKSSEASSRAFNQGKNTKK